MKKKRGENTRKSDPNNNNHNSNTKNNGDSSNGSSNTPNDSHHNQSAPCSNLAAAIAREIFPSIAKESSSMNNTASKEAVSHGMVDSKNGGDKNDEGSVASVSISEQPLLGYMIHRYLLEERKHAREMTMLANGEFSNHNSNLGEVITEGSTIFHKKKKIKKKKKKKKKKSSCSGEDLGEDIKNGNNCNKGEGLSSAGVAAVSANGKENSVNTVETPSSSGDGIIHTIKTTSECDLCPSLHFNGVTNNNNHTRTRTSLSQYSLSRTGLDRFLDSMIESEQSCQDTNLAATHHRGEGERNLEAFSAYLQRKFESQFKQSMHVQHTQQLQLQKKEKCKGGSTATKTTSSSSVDCLRESSMYKGKAFYDVLPTISFDDVNDIVSKIDCRKCRTSASSWLRSVTINEGHTIFRSGGSGVELNNNSSRSNNTADTTKHPASIILNHDSANTSPTHLLDTKNSGLAIPVCGAFSDDVEKAFHYLNMDELDLEVGKGVGGDIEQEGADSNNSCAPISSLYLELLPICETDNAVRYLQIGTLSGQNSDDNGIMCPKFPVTATDVIDLVKHILLPCGLMFEKDHLVDLLDNPYGLSDKDLSTIAGKAFVIMNPIHQSFYVANQNMTSIKNIMENADRSNTRSYIDATTTKMLHEADDKIELVLKQVGEIILKIFKSICFVGWSLTRGPRLLQFMICLWNRYNAALDSLVGPTVQYRGRLAQSCDRDRAIPQAYSNPVVRNSFHETVKAKVMFLTSLLRDFSNFINGDGESSPSPMIEVFVLQALRQHVDAPKMQSVDAIFPDQESEELVQQLIAAQIDVSQKTIKSVFLDGVREKSTVQRNKLDGLCKTMRKIIIAMEDFAPETKLEFLRIGYESNESIYYDLVKSNNSLCASDTDFEARNTTLLLKMSANLVMQWMIQLISRQCHESSLGSLVLPSSLEKWLNNPPITEFSPSTAKDENEREECVGNGGERRVSSILAGLVYRWLEARCLEWHAELSKDELLLLMDNDDAIVGHDDSGKVAKKKKSKRKTVSESNPINVVQVQGVGNGIGMEPVHVDLDSTNAEICVFHKSGRQGENMKIDDDLFETIPTTTTFNLNCEYHPHVGVVDGQQVLAAEMYLVSRLQVILQEGADSTIPVFFA